MKKWFLVLVTALAPVFALSANAASVYPSDLFKFIKSSKPAATEPSAEQGVGGPLFPNNGLSHHREEFRSWVIAQTERRGRSEQPREVVHPNPPAAVPLPAAAWLFGSALLGLAGVARRTRS